MKTETDNSRTKTSIAIFASGTGSNAQRIIDYFRNHPKIIIALIDQPVKR